MVNYRGRDKWADRLKKKPWLWSVAGALLLIPFAVALAVAASWIYDSGNRNGFWSVFASGVLLNGAVVALLGVAVTTPLAVASEIRFRMADVARKRLELFGRMRAAHVKI